MRRALALALLLGSGPLLAEEGDAEGAPAAELPTELPPPGDELLDLLGEAEPQDLEGIRVFAHGRVRLELDESRDRSPDPDLQTGFTLRGRVGLDAPVGPHRARIVLGDGVRLGEQRVTLPLPFVARDPASFLYRVELELDAPVLGQAGRLSLGRFPVQVADGRMVGRTDADPRGRTLDGGLWSFASEQSVVRLGAFYLGPLDPGDGSDPSGLLFLDRKDEVGGYLGDLYVLMHRDGTPARAGRDAVNALTVGARQRLALGWFYGRVGLDGQAALRDDDPLTPEGLGGHAELALGLAVDSAAVNRAGVPRLELGGELTTGERVEGRRFRTPAPDLHRFLGALDYAATDNAWSAWLTLALDDDNGFSAAVEPRLLGLVDGRGPLLDVLDRALIPVSADPDYPALALFEVDARVRIPAGPGVFLDGEYAIGFARGAFSGSVPTQRLWLAITFDTETEARP